MIVAKMSTDSKSTADAGEEHSGNEREFWYKKRCGFQRKSISSSPLPSKRKSKDNKKSSLKLIVVIVEKFGSLSTN